MLKQMGVNPSVSEEAPANSQQHSSSASSIVQDTGLTNISPNQTKQSPAAPAAVSTLAAPASIPAPVETTSAISPVEDQASSATSAPRCLTRKERKCLKYSESDVNFSPEFEEFWNVYPKKQKKTKAFTVWKQLKDANMLPPVETLIESVNAVKHSPSWQKEEGRFIPQAHNWLKELRWRDTHVSSKFRRSPASQQDYSIPPKKQLTPAEIEEDRKLRKIFDELASLFKTLPENMDAAFEIWKTYRSIENITGIYPEEVPEIERGKSLMEYLQAQRKASYQKSKRDK